MTAPNLLALTTITATNANVAIGSSATSLASNASSSSELYKIDSLYIANADNVAVTVTVNYYSAASLGGTAYPICSGVSIPANTTLVVIERDSPVFLVENTSLGALASTASELTATIAYEVCS
jgi:hypothetical protein